MKRRAKEGHKIYSQEDYVFLFFGGLCLAESSINYIQDKDRALQKKDLQVITAVFITRFLTGIELTAVDSDVAYR
jgi:uncharacterized protein (DUF2235 family)